MNPRRNSRSPNVASAGCDRVDHPGEGRKSDFVLCGPQEPSSAACGLGDLKAGQYEGQAPQFYIILIDSCFFGFCFYILVCVYAYIHAYVPQHECRGQKTTCKSCFSPSTMWILRIELRSSGECLPAEPSRPSFMSLNINSIIRKHKHIWNNFGLRIYFLN